PNMGALKLTIQQFYRPGGDSTQKRGVVSDVELPSLTTQLDVAEADLDYALELDRKSTRLNSSHQIISYAVFCLKKKKYLVNNTSREVRRSHTFPTTISGSFEPT